MCDRCRYIPYGTESEYIDLPLSLWNRFRTGFLIFKLNNLSTQIVLNLHSRILTVHVVYCHHILNAELALARLNEIYFIVSVGISVWPGLLIASWRSIEENAYSYREAWIANQPNNLFDQPISFNQLAILTTRVIEKMVCLLNSRC